VATIAERAGVSKGMIYYYFENKEALMMGVVNSGFDRLAVRMHEIAKRSTDPIKRISDSVKEYLTYSDKHRAFHKVLLKEAVHILPKAGDTFRSCIVSHVKHLEELMSDGVSSMKLRKVDTRFAALCLLEMVSAATRASVLLNRRIDIKRDHKTIMDIFLRGIARQ
jgi:AcrR family transcriptional regulator